MDKKISFLQAYGILLVVLIHSLRGHGELQVWIAQFIMPLFMFISGYLFSLGLDKRQIRIYDVKLFGNKGLLLNKAKRLLVPFTFVNLLAFFPKCLLNSYADHPAELSLSFFCRQYIYPYESVVIFLWFLPTLFLVFVSIVFIAKLFFAARIELPCWFWMLCSLILLLVNPFADVEFLNIGKVVYYNFFFLFGVSWFKYGIAEYIVKYMRFVFPISLLGLLALPCLPYFYDNGVTAAIIGIVMSFCLATLYVQKRWKFLNHLFGASYTIYLLSWFPQVLCQQVLLSVIDIPWQVGSILALITGAYFPFLVHVILTKWSDYKLANVALFLMGQ